MASFSTSMRSLCTSSNASKCNCVFPIDWPSSQHFPGLGMFRLVRREEGVCRACLADSADYSYVFTGFSSKSLMLQLSPFVPPGGHSPQATPRFRMEASCISSRTAVCAMQSITLNGMIRTILKRIHCKVLNLVWKVVVDDTPAHRKHPV